MCVSVCMSSDGQVTNPGCIPATYLATAGTDATALCKQRHEWVTLNGCLCVSQDSFIH